MAADLSNPILNSPYDPPEAHFELGQPGRPGNPAGRRPSESFIPVPVSRKGSKAAEQLTLDFDVTGERREQNTLINDIRREVERWRASNWNGVTPSRASCCALGREPPDRENRSSSASARPPRPRSSSPRSPAATALPTTARGSSPRTKLHNDGLPRVALKMATGTGKTVVMAMLIAWQTLNKVMTPERRPLRQAVPGRHARASRSATACGCCARATTTTTTASATSSRRPVGALLAGADRDHQLPRLPAPGRQGDPGRRRQHSQAPARRQAEEADPFKETPDDGGRRVLRELRRRQAARSWCSTTRRTTATRTSRSSRPDERAPTSEDEDAQRASARVWFRGLRAVQRKVGIKAVYDLSATPFYLKGSGYNEGFIFPWVGQRLLADRRHRVRHRQGAARPGRRRRGRRASSTYRDLWDHIRRRCRRSGTRPRDVGTDRRAGCRRRARRRAAQPLPQLRADASRAGRTTLARARRAAAGVHRRLQQHRVSKLVFDWIAGWDVELRRRDQPSRARQAAAVQQRRATARGSTGRARSSSTPRSSSPARR